MLVLGWADLFGGCYEKTTVKGGPHLVFGLSVEVGGVVHMTRNEEFKKGSGVGLLTSSAIKSDQPPRTLSYKYHSKSTHQTPHTLGTSEIAGWRSAQDEEESKKRYE